MCTLTAAVYLIILFGVAYGLDPLSAIHDQVVLQRREYVKSRQSDTCSLPASYPDQCEIAFDDLNRILGFSRLEDLDLNELNAVLDTVCTYDCVGPEIEFYRCLDEQDLADFVSNGICGESNGNNCFVLWFDGIISNFTVVETNCSESGSCDAQCRGSLQRTADFLGCCAASLYNNSASVFSPLIPPDQFATCNVNIGQACLSISGAGVNRVGFGLLAIFAAVVALVNYILF